MQNELIENGEVDPWEHQGHFKRPQFVQAQISIVSLYIFIILPSVKKIIIYIYL